MSEQKTEIKKSARELETQLSNIVYELLQTRMKLTKLSTSLEEYNVLNQKEVWRQLDMSWYEIRKTMNRIKKTRRIISSWTYFLFYVIVIGNDNRIGEKKLKQEKNAYDACHELKDIRQELRKLAVRLTTLGHEIKEYNFLFSEDIPEIEKTIKSSFTETVRTSNRIQKTLENLRSK